MAGNRFYQWPLNLRPSSSGKWAKDFNSDLDLKFVKYAGGDYFDCGSYAKGEKAAHSNWLGVYYWKDGNGGTRKCFQTMDWTDPKSSLDKKTSANYDITKYSNPDGIFAKDKKNSFFVNISDKADHRVCFTWCPGRAWTRTTNDWEPDNVHLGPTAPAPYIPNVIGFSFMWTNEGSHDSVNTREVSPAQVGLIYCERNEHEGASNPNNGTRNNMYTIVPQKKIGQGSYGIETGSIVTKHFSYVFDDSQWATLQSNFNMDSDNYDRWLFVGFFIEMKFRGHGGSTGWSGIGKFWNFRPIVAESPSVLTEKFEDVEKYVVSADPYRSTRKTWCMRKPPADGFKREPAVLWSPPI